MNMSVYIYVYIYIYIYAHAYATVTITVSVTASAFIYTCIHTHMKICMIVRLTHASAEKQTCKRLHEVCEKNIKDTMPLIVAFIIHAVTGAIYTTRIYTTHLC